MRELPPTFSAPDAVLFARIVEEWGAWKQGIPPSSEWAGLNAQNPHLLRAFAALDRAEVRANRDRMIAARRKG